MSWATTSSILDRVIKEQLRILRMYQWRTKLKIFQYDKLKIFHWKEPQKLKIFQEKDQQRLKIFQEMDTQKLKIFQEKDHQCLSLDQVNLQL
jgi:regulator of protease activity HflC (stomatin/prohibitin superfamily)